MLFNILFITLLIIIVIYGSYSIAISNTLNEKHRINMILLISIFMGMFLLINEAKKENKFTTKHFVAMLRVCTPPLNAR